MNTNINLIFYKLIFLPLKNILNVVYFIKILFMNLILPIKINKIFFSFPILILLYKII